MELAATSLSRVGSQETRKTQIQNHGIQRGYSTCSMKPSCNMSTERQNPAPLTPRTLGCFQKAPACPETHKCGLCITGAPVLPTGIKCVSLSGLLISLAHTLSEIFLTIFYTPWTTISLHTTSELLQCKLHVAIPLCCTLIWCLIFFFATINSTTSPAVVVHLGGRGRWVS